MKRWLPLLTLGLISSLPAQAIEWPWDARADVDYGYCKGFTVGALASIPVERLSRTRLWLNWNQIIRAELPAGAIYEDDYRAGRARFEELLASGDVEAMRDIARHQCRLNP